MPLGPILSDVLDVLVMLLAPSFASGKICCGPMGSRMIQVQQTYLAVKLPEVVASAVKDHWRQGGPVLPMPTDKQRQRETSKFKVLTTA